MHELHDISISLGGNKYILFRVKCRTQTIHNIRARAIGRGGWRRGLGTATTVYVHDTYTYILYIRFVYNNRCNTTTRLYEREKYVTVVRTFGTSGFFFITFLSLKDLPKTGDHDARTYIQNNNIIPQYPTYAMCDH